MAKVKKAQRHATQGKVMKKKKLSLTDKQSRASVESRIHKICQALSKFQAPKHNVEMLIKGLPFALRDYHSERHFHQTMMINCAKEALLSIESDLVDNIKKHQYVVDNEQSVKQENTRKVDKSEAEVQQRERLLEELKLKREQKKSALDQANVKVEQSKKDCKAKAAVVTKMEEEKEADRVVFEDHFKVMMEAPKITKAVSQKHLQPIVSCLNKLDLDDSLVMALPTALSKRPEERGNFDEMVVNYALTAFQNKRVALEEGLVDARNKMLGANDLHTQCETTLGNARAEYDETIDLTKDTENDKKKFVAETKDNFKNVKSHEHDIHVASTLMKKAQKEYEIFQTVLTAFHDLEMRDHQEPIGDAPDEEETVPELTNATPKANADVAMDVDEQSDQAEQETGTDEE